jgi:hypothetical protein
MSEGRISSFIDQSSIKKEGDYFKGILADIYNQYIKIKETKITLEGAKTFTEAAQNVSVLKKTTDELTGSVVKAATSLQKQQDAYTILIAQQKDAEATAKRLAAQYGVESDQAIKAANAAVKLKEQLTAINDLSKSGGITFEQRLAQQLQNIRTQGAESVPSTTEAIPNTSNDTKEDKKNIDALTQSEAALTKARNDDNVKIQENKILQKQATDTAKQQALQNLGLVDSYKQLEQEFKAQSANAKNLQAQYIALSETEKQSGSGQQLKQQSDAATAAANDLNNKLKSIDAGVGQFTRNVGNYANAFATALNPVQNKLEQIRNDINSGNFGGEALSALQRQEAALVQVTEQLSQEFSTTKQQSRAFQEAVAEIGVQFGQDSHVFQEFKNQVGEGVDSLNDIRESIKRASSDTQKLDAIVNATQALAGGFAIAQGAAALFGEQDNELQKTFVKLQAVMTVLNGLQAIQNELKNKDSIIRKAVNFLYNSEIKLTQADAAAKTLDAEATETATTATKGFGVALKSIGIGVLLTVIGFLLSSFTALGAKTSEVNKYFGETDEKSKQVNDSLKKMGATVSEIADSVLQKLTSEIDNLNEQLGETPTLIEQAQKSLKALQDQLQDQTGAFSFAGIDAIIKTAQQVEETKTKIQQLQEKQRLKNLDTNLKDETNLYQEETKQQAQLIIDANNRILSNDKSSYTDRLSALQSNLSQQRVIIQQELNKGLSDAGPDGSKRKLAQDKANADLIKSQRDFNDQSNKLNEEYLKLREQAESNILKRHLQNVSDVNKQIADNDQQAYSLRLGSLNNYVHAQEQLIELEKNNQLKAAKTTEQRLDIEDDAQNKLTHLYISSGIERNTILQKQLQDEQALIDKMHDEINKPEDQSAKLQAQKDLVNDEIEIVKNGMESRLKEIQISSVNEQTELQKKYDEGKISYEDYQNGLATIQKNAAEKSLKVTIDSAKTQLDLLTKAGKAGTKEWDDLRLAIANAENQLQAFSKAVPKLGDNASDGLKDLEKQLEKINDATKKLSDVTLAALDIGYTKQKNQLQDIEDQQQKNYEQQVTRVNSSTLTEEQKANRLKILEAQRTTQKEQNDRKERQLETERARFQKAANIANIITETALAVVHELATGDPYTAIPRAIAAGALGGAELAIAIATPVPHYKHGVKDSPANHGQGTYAVVGDGKKPEVVQHPDGTTYLTPARDTLVYLPEHSRVYPDANQFIKSATTATFTNTKVVEVPRENNNAPLERMMGLLIKENRQLRSAVSNKKELHVDMNSLAAHAMYKHIQGEILYINNQTNW